MKFKLKVSTIIAITAISFSSVVGAGGIPTYDGLNVAQAMKQVENGVQQINQLKSQLEQMKAQYKAITGSRGFGELLTNNGLKSALPQDWQKVYDTIKSGGYKGLDGTARAIADAAKLADKCKQYPVGSDRQKTCETAAVRTAQTQSNILSALENTSNRLENLKQMAKKIDVATDSKAIQDLTARINIEQAAIQNEQTRLQLFKHLQEEQDKMARIEAMKAAQKSQEVYVQNLRKRYGK